MGLPIISLKLEVRLTTADCCCASIRNIVVMVWRRTPSIEAFERAYINVKSIFTRYKSTAIIVVTRGIIPPADSAVSDYSAKQLQLFGRSLKAVAMVGDNSEPVDKPTRLSRNLHTLFLEPSRKNFETCDQAAEWVSAELMRHKGEEVQLTELKLALELFEDHVATLTKD